MTTDAFVAHLRRRWWVVALQALLAVVVVIVVSAVTTKASYSFTAQFVMHPAPATPTGDVANLAQELDASGPIVQTVLRVLSTPGMVSRAAQEANISDTGPYSLSASVSPGTTVFDATITGPDSPTVKKLGDALEQVAPTYVAAAYRGYSFDLLGNNTGKQKGFPPRTDIVLLALLLGAVVGVGEVYAEFTYRQLPRRARAGANQGVEGNDVDTNDEVGSAVPAPPAERDRAPARRDRTYAVDAAVDGNGSGNGNGAHRGGGPSTDEVPAKKRASRASSRRPQQQGPTSH
jgi:capsular polysaccharide biosynthesis protein